MTVVVVNDKPADLSKAFPLTWDDAVVLTRTLESLGAPVTPAMLDNPTVEFVEEFVAFVLHKANPEITLSDVLRLRWSDMDRIALTLRASWAGVKAEGVNANG